MQWLQREAVLKADVAGAKAETKQWCDKDAASREQLQQVVDVVGKLQSKFTAVEDEIVDSEKEIEDLLSEVDLSQINYQEIERKLEDANSEF